MTSATTNHSNEQELLHAAFRSFDEAAHTLQQSYSALTARVEQMDGELAQSNEALRRQLCDNEAMRVHLDGILESLSAGVLVMDDGETISRSNRAAEVLLGATDAGLRNRRATDVLAGAGLSICDRPQRIGQTVVSISQVPLRNDSAAHSGHLILFQDITRIYQLEEQLQRKERLAAMGELIGRIAHEIRNPLGSVELFASMLQRDVDEHSSARRYAQQISQAVQLMDRLLANLLLYTRPVRMARGWHGGEPVDRQSHQVGRPCDHQSAGGNSSGPRSGDPVDLVSRGTLKQVLVNLVVNAVSGDAERGLLAISLSTGTATGPRDARRSADRTVTPASASSRPIARAYLILSLRRRRGNRPRACDRLFNRRSASRTDRCREHGRARHLLFDILPHPSDSNQRESEGHHKIP